MQITNLGLLPDGGLKLKQAIKREEDTLKDTVKQLQNVAEKLKQFPGIVVFIFFTKLYYLLNQISIFRFFLESYK